MGAGSDPVGGRRTKAALGRVDRYREIAVVLTRHGFGILAARIGLERWMPQLQGRGHLPEESRTDAEQLRLALEELGPAFVKLGQLMSTRPDHIPVSYANELAKLQDSATPVPYEAVAATIESELGAPPEQLYATFDPTPIASASIGQAHAATLHDGTAVVVKVRRPDVVDRITEDLDILQRLARDATRLWPTAADWDLEGLSAQFAKSLRGELDYVKEGRNAERFAQNFADDTRIHIPVVFWDLTTSEVITLERIRGVKADDVDALRAAGIDPRVIIERAVDLIAQMVFVDGFFHGDPHPGNFFIEADGTIGLIDFGKVGSIADPLRDHLSDLLIAVYRGDPERIASALLRVASSRHSVDIDALRVDVADFIERYSGLALGELQLGPIFSRVFGTLRHHRLHLPPDLASMLRMLVMVEGLGERLDPDFHLSESLKPYAQRLVFDQLSPRALLKRATRAGSELAALGLELPDRLRRIIDRMDVTGVEVHLRAAELEPVLDRVERIGNRVVAGLISTALIGAIGQVTSRGPQKSWVQPVVGAGLGAVAALGGYLAWTSRPRLRRRG